MVSEVTRYVTDQVQRELWARAAGRCQFDGHNRLLYTSCVTQESVNAAQKAHIYAFSENGPRGRGPYRSNVEPLNDVSNLMLMCYDCHKKIDQAGGEDRYPAELLLAWKKQHEQRVEIVTGIASDKKSHVVLYGANIGSEKSPIQFHACVEAMFPQWYPACERPVLVSMKSELNDSSPLYWRTESQHLLKAFQRKVLSIIEDDPCKHFSLFALAPQPLLIQLGALLTDKIDVETYQLHREPKGWFWQDSKDDFDYVINKPDDYDGYRGEYGIEDTRQALAEAKHAGIHPFCITIDQQAREYLPHMYGAVNYTLIDDVRQLPIRVSSVYRQLTV